MRLLVLFDLPTATKQDRKNYMQFRKFLISDGYDMLQFSVYSRIAKNRDDIDMHVYRLKNSLPPKGQVRALAVTEKQYAQMIVLLGTLTVSEEKLADRELLVL
jgi:CRISPR-associated protein Cas2